MENKKSALDHLDKIEQVDVSPFLYTRILQKIEQSALQDLPKPWAWTLVSFSAACLVLTIFAISTNMSNQTELQGLDESVNFVPTNTLYHD
jgi:hypothetical protein